MLGPGHTVLQGHSQEDPSLRDSQVFQRVLVFQEILEVPAGKQRTQRSAPVQVLAEGSGSGLTIGPAGPLGPLGPSFPAGP